MKFTNKVLIYFAVMLGLSLAVWMSSERLRPIFIAAGILWQLFCGGYFFRFGKRLENGIEYSRESEAFSGYFGAENEKVFQELARREEQLSRQIKGHYSVQVEDRQMQINSLQSQINPHFLYNTLECIRSEAVKQKSDSIARMARALAAFFRYNISRKEDIVTVQDELDNIKNYIMIQNYRFEDKFQFEIVMEDEQEEILNYLIPKMTIQPILENSIYHGLETKAGECIVRISFRATDQELMIMVSDNGTGMDEETLSRLREGLVKEKDVNIQNKGNTVHGNGVALYNVNQRIRLIFGKSYGMSVYSTRNVGTDVEIILPIMEKMSNRG